MEDFIFKILLALFTAALSYLTAIMHEERKERKEERKLQDERHKKEAEERQKLNVANQEMLGYMLDRWHEEYTMQEYVTSRQRNQFESVFNAYAALGGNGARLTKWEEIQALHVDDTKSSMSPFLRFYFEKKNNVE